MRTFLILTIFTLFGCYLALPLIQNDGNNELNNEIFTNSDDLQQTYLQGVCNSSRDPLIYTENFILQNDNNSQIAAAIRTSVSGQPSITCVEIISRTNDTERPKILDGGIGANYVEIGVKPTYGKGFDFTLKLYGSYFTRNKTYAIISYR